MSIFLMKLLENDLKHCKTDIYVVNAFYEFSVPPPNYNFLNIGYTDGARWGQEGTYCLL